MTPYNFGSVPPRGGRRIAGVHWVADFSFVRMQFPVQNTEIVGMGNIGAGFLVTVAGAATGAL